MLAYTGDPDIRLGVGPINMFPSISCLILLFGVGQSLEPNWMGGHGRIYPSGSATELKTQQSHNRK